MTRTFFQSIFAATLLGNAAAFVARSSSPTFIRPTSQLELFTPPMSDALEAAANNVWLATIDADIQSIPNDQFGLVFGGGIAVMLGGVLSATFVGFLLEKGNLYANLAAESYLQSADDEEFWKNLSDEEQVKAKELLAKIKASKEGGSVPSDTQETESTPAAAATTTTSSSLSPAAEAKAPSKPADMFSDYGE